MSFSSFKSYGSGVAKSIFQNIDSLKFHYTGSFTDGLNILNIATSQYDAQMTFDMVSGLAPIRGDYFTFPSGNEESTGARFLTLPLYKNSNNGFSITFWSNMASNVGNLRYISYGDSFELVSRSFILMFRIDGVEYNLKTRFTDTTWRHYAFIFDSNRQLRFYLNGVLTTSIRLPSYPKIDSIGYWGRGAVLQSGERLFVGAILAIIAINVILVGIANIIYAFRKNKKEKEKTKTEN